MTRRRAASVLLAALVLTVALASRASAGEYPVYACEPAYGDVNHSWSAESSTPLMAAYSNCPVPWSETREWNRGLVTLHPVSGAGGGQPVGGFSYAALRFRAPPGASLARMTYSHTFCGASTFSAGLVNDAARWLHVSGPGVCGSFLPSPFTLSLDGTPSVALMTICSKSECNTSGDERAYASMRSATVWVADSTPPAVTITGGSILGGWRHGSQTVVFNAADNVGVRHFDVYLDDKRAVTQDGLCDWTYAVPCATPTGSIQAESTIVPDGQHTLNVTAMDSAGNWGGTKVPVYVDNTAPTSPDDLEVAGGESWRASNGFDVAWTDPAQTGTAPITAVGWTICPAANGAGDTTGCVSGGRSGTGIAALDHLQVPRPGDWVARFWLGDAAGNADARSARAAHLRYDPTAPDLAILPPDPSDPQRLTVTAADSLSGVTRVEVEVRRDGDDAWISLPVTAANGQFVAYLDDAALPGGHYLLRARASDAAGNERTTDVRAGAPAALDLPVRLRAALGVRAVVATRRRHGRRRVVLRRHPVTAFGRPTVLRGRLTLPGDNAVADAGLEVSEQTALPGEPWRRVGLVRTGRTGGFEYKAPAGPSRLLRLSYAGTPLVMPSHADIPLRVRARTSFTVNRARVVNGDEVLFRGRVRGQLPSTGKLLQLQAYSRGTWRTFATPRASRRSHRWRYTYRFSATRGLVRYRFRAVVPAEAAFPYARGTSRSLYVTVRGL